MISIAAQEKSSRFQAIYSLAPRDEKNVVCLMQNERQG